MGQPNMSASDTTIYEVHVRRGSAWEFDMSTGDQEEAIDEAQRLAAKGNVTKVTRETFCEADGLFRGHTIYKSDVPKIAPLPAAPAKRAHAAPVRPAVRPQPARKKGFMERLFG
jgi:hypothetical protein